MSFLFCGFIAWSIKAFIFFEHCALKIKYDHLIVAIFILHTPIFPLLLALSRRQSWLAALWHSSCLYEIEACVLPRYDFLYSKFAAARHDQIFSHVCMKYRIISNYSYTLLIRTPPFPGKILMYSNRSVQLIEIIIPSEARF